MIILHSTGQDPMPPRGMVRRKSLMFPDNRDPLSNRFSVWFEQLSTRINPEGNRRQRTEGKFTYGIRDETRRTNTESERLRPLQLNI